MWMAAAGMALNMLSQSAADEEKAAQQYAEKTVGQAKDYASNTIGEANAYAQNVQRQGRNSFEIAQANLSNTARSIKNQTALINYGNQKNALETNIARQSDAMSKGNLVAQLQTASTLGALRADAAYRGVGGSSRQILQDAASLHQGAVATEAADKAKQLSWDQTLQRAGMIRTAYLNVDLTQDLPNIDYGVTQAPISNSGTYFQSSGGLTSTVLKALPGVLSAATDYFKDMGTSNDSKFYDAGAASAASAGTTFGQGGAAYTPQGGGVSNLYSSGKSTGMFTGA